MTALPRTSPRSGRLPGRRHRKHFRRRRETSPRTKYWSHSIEYVECTNCRPDRPKPDHAVRFLYFRPVRICGTGHNAWTSRLGWSIRWKHSRTPNSTNSRRNISTAICTGWWRLIRAKPQPFTGTWVTSSAGWRSSRILEYTAIAEAMIIGEVEDRMRRLDGACAKSRT
jgi:hypothetical protein